MRRKVATQCIATFSTPIDVYHGGILQAFSFKAVSPTFNRLNRLRHTSSNDTFASKLPRIIISQCTPLSDLVHSSQTNLQRTFSRYQQNSVKHLRTNRQSYGDSVYSHVLNIRQGNSSVSRLASSSFEYSTIAHSRHVASSSSIDSSVRSQLRYFSHSSNCEFNCLSETKRFCINRSGLNFINPFSKQSQFYNSSNRHFQSRDYSCQHHYKFSEFDAPMLNVTASETSG